MRRTIAKNYGLRFYEDFCDTHMFAPHYAAFGSCLHCPLPETAQTDRRLARQAGLKSYLDKCPTHHLTPHSPVNGKCLTCYTSAGVVRSGTRGMPLSVGARAVARRSGETTYMHVCRGHGETAHSVMHGKCLVCFTTSGAKRVRGIFPPGPSNDPLA